jgi:hypothetical protein
MNRTRLLAILDAMPDDAFAFVTAWIVGPMLPEADQQGFRTSDLAALEALRNEADRLRKGSA